MPLEVLQPIRYNQDTGDGGRWEMSVAAMGACEDALQVDSYFQRNGSQVLEQIKQVRTRHGRTVSLQVTEIDNPGRKSQQGDTLCLQGTAQPPDRALVAALGQMAQPQQERRDEPGRAFSKQEFDFLWQLFGRDRQ